MEKIKHLLSLIPYDKKLHISCSFIIAAFIGLLTGYFHIPTCLCIFLAWILTFIIGILKEVRDSKQPGNHFCFKDLIADAIGCTLGCWTGLFSLLI